VTCEACRAAAAAPVCEADDGTLLRCPACGTWRLLPRRGVDDPNDAEYGDAYRDGLDDAKPARCLEILRARVPRPPGGRLLDVGCSDGAFLALAVGDGWRVAGLDPDPEAVRAARLRGIDAAVGHAGGPAPPGAPFDAVTLWDVLEHLGEPDRVVAWLADAVREGGRVAAITPDAGSLFDRLGAAERAVSGGRSRRLTTLCLNRYHLHRFTARGLARLFERHGFRVEAMERVQVFSLRPERYLAGFAPGIRAWTPLAGLNRALSRALFAGVRLTGVRNKLLVVARREAPPSLP
jgi:SAM-dependent methyltransferase